MVVTEDAKVAIESHEIFTVDGIGTPPGVQARLTPKKATSIHSLPATFSVRSTGNYSLDLLWKDGSRAQLCTLREHFEVICAEPYVSQGGACVKKCGKEYLPHGDECKAEQGQKKIIGAVFGGLFVVILAAFLFYLKRNRQHFRQLASSFLKNEVVIGISFAFELCEPAQQKQKIKHTQKKDCAQFDFTLLLCLKVSLQVFFM